MLLTLIDPLFATSSHCNLRRLPIFTRHIKPFRFQRFKRLLDQIISVSAVLRVFTERLNGNQQLNSLPPQIFIHCADAVQRRPNQLVDFIHLPLLMAFAEGGVKLAQDTDTVIGMIAAVDPAAQRRLYQ